MSQEGSVGDLDRVLTDDHLKNDSYRLNLIEGASKERGGQIDDISLSD